MAPIAQIVYSTREGRALRAPDPVAYSCERHVPGELDTYRLQYVSALPQQEVTSRVSVFEVAAVRLKYSGSSAESRVCTEPARTAGHRRAAIG